MKDLYKFKYKLGEAETIEEYVEKYAEKYQLNIKDEIYRRYYVGNNKVEYNLKGNGELYLYYGETINYEIINIWGNYKIYSIIQPENFSAVHRKINLYGQVELRFIGIGGYVEAINNIYLYKGAKADDRGISFTKDNQESIYKSILNHIESNTKSYSHYRAIVNDSSRTSLEGFINIGPEAYESDSFLDQHVIILNNQANAFTFPALKIENNNVKASHSATISKLPEEMLLYLQSRAISKQEAISLLIKGFANKVLDIKELEEVIDNYINLK